MPTVSCILAAWNAEKYLVKAVESILNQTYTDFELILIDDGSLKDRTPQIVKDFGKKDSRVVAISRPNRRLTPTLNEGLGRAMGRYIARMDADDIAFPTRFEKQVAYLDAHPECVCVGSRVKLIDPYGSVIKTTDHATDHETIEAQLLRGIAWAVVHPAWIMRKDAVDKIGGYREQFVTSQDLDILLRLSEVGKLANLEEPLTGYRQHFESVANTKADEQWRVKGIIVGDAYDRRGWARPAEWPFERRIVQPFEKQLEQWTWHALRAGNKKAARRHALELFQRKPASKVSWKTLLCALRGH